MGFARRLLPLVMMAGCAAPPESPRDETGPLIEALGDDDAGVRDRATAKLRSLLPEAADALARHVDDSDAEVAARCRALIYQPPDDWTWYQTSGLSGIDLQIVDSLADLSSWCGNAKMEARMMLPKLRSLQLHPATCLPHMRFTGDACPDHGLPLFRITVDLTFYDRVAAELDSFAPLAEASMIATLGLIARRTGTDFTLSREGVIRFQPRKAVFECRWNSLHHDQLRKDGAVRYEERSAERIQTAWEEARKTFVRAWALLH